MSHAEALQTLHPAVGATEAIVEFVNELRHAALTDEVRHYARRHLLDTVGVMIAGAGGEVATRAVQLGTAAWDQRISISKAEKFRLVGQAFAEALRPAPPVNRAGLWTRPAGA